MMTYWYVAVSSALLFFMLDAQLNRRWATWLVFAVAAAIVWGLMILFMLVLTWTMHTPDPTMVVRLVA